MTTYAGFLNGLRDLSVSGVTNLSEPPASLSAEGLPAKWVQLPVGNEPVLTFGYNGGWTRFKADVVIALVPAMQGTQNQNWVQAVAMLDTFTTALRGADVCESVLTWSIQQTGVAVGDMQYWAIVANVEGNG